MAPVLSCRARCVVFRPSGWRWWLSAAEPANPREPAPEVCRAVAAPRAGRAALLPGAADVREPAAEAKARAREERRAPAGGGGGGGAPPRTGRAGGGTQ